MDAKTLVPIVISLIWFLCLVVCFLKAKYGMAIVGLVAAVAQEVGLPPIGGYYILNLIYPLWLLPFFGAIRLAHPKSYYANWFYRRNIHKYWRAVERFGLIEEYATRIAGDTELSTEFELFLRRKLTPEQRLSGLKTTLPRRENDKRTRRKTHNERCNGLTKRWSEPPTAARSHFQMIKTVSLEAALALSGGRSACSR
jgi:hypothetical protein